MRISSTYGVPSPGLETKVGPTSRPAADTAAGTSGANPAETTVRTFSVLNDYRYLTESDKDLLRHVTGEEISPSIIDASGPQSAFAQQLALDRRTGDLAPNQLVTAVYLTNASAALDAGNAGRARFANPYSGPVLADAVAYLASIGRAKADIRL